MGEILAGEATPAQIAGFAVALRAKGETDRRGRRAWSTRCTPRATPLARARAGCSTSSAPAATARCRSTSPRWPRSWPPAPAPGWSSTATARPRRSPAPPTCSRRSASGSTCRPTRVAEVAERGRHHVLLRRGLPPGACGTPPCPRRELGIGTTFNFLGPLANPARPGAQAIGCADAADGAGDGRRVRRAAASTPGCSAATTGSTS